MCSAWINITWCSSAEHGFGAGCSLHASVALAHVHLVLHPKTSGAPAALCKRGLACFPLAWAVMLRPRQPPRPQPCRKGAASFVLVGWGCSRGHLPRQRRPTPTPLSRLRPLPLPQCLLVAPAHSPGRNALPGAALWAVASLLPRDARRTGTSGAVPQMPPRAPPARQPDPVLGKRGLQGSCMNLSRLPGPGSLLFLPRTRGKWHGRGKPFLNVRSPSRRGSCRSLCVQKQRSGASLPRASRQ